MYGTTVLPLGDVRCARHIRLNIMRNNKNICTWNSFDWQDKRKWSKQSSVIINLDYIVNMKMVHVWHVSTYIIFS